MWRIHNPNGVHRVAWNYLRSFGPLTRARFDPWVGEPAEQSGAVGYFATDWSTCLAEYFQETRRVTTSTNCYITGFTPTRTLDLLDLRGEYPIKVGASHSLNGGTRTHCRAWSHAFRTALPSLDGFVYAGMNSLNCFVLFENTWDAFPKHPGFSRALFDPSIYERLAVATKNINYEFDIL